MNPRQPLDQELIRSVLEYNNDIGNLLWLKTVSFRAKKGDIAGTIDSYGYRKLTIRGTQLIAARVVWFLCNGEDIIDKVFYYKNRDLQDIRIENLEVVSRKELADRRIYK
jgi:ABC-type histidine transport system ATPase subunit